MHTRLSIVALLIAPLLALPACGTTALSAGEQPGDEQLPLPSDARDAGDEALPPLDGGPAVPGEEPDAGDGGAEEPDVRDGGTEEPDAGHEPQVDAGLEPQVDAGLEPPVDPEEGSCLHTYGGGYANRACSASYQCCDGAWRAGQGSCGACACVEATGQHGCGLPDDGEPDGGVPDAGLPDDGEETDAGPGAIVDAGPGQGSGFLGTKSPLPDDVRARMTGLSWRPGCPVSLDDLSLLEVSHWGFDGQVHTGELVVAAWVADDVLAALEDAFAANYPIQKMVLVDDYLADDGASMADNNTSAFNCRQLSSGAWSQHAYGTAIDVNPLINPYVRGAFIDPPEGAEYADRSLAHPAMIHEGDDVTAAFDAIGWGWGGRWSSAKDWQHFSENGL